MNKSRILVPALAMLFLSACASTQSPSQFTASTSNDDTLVDQYMDAVNSSAAANHAEVHWINVPEEKDLVRYNKKD